jgi:fluoroacetyl-CoA thioesterase
MKLLFSPGDKIYFEKIVQPEDTATFASGTVHPVYATFALARDAEWSSRLFVLQMKEAEEEGIGTFINIQHHSPGLVNQVVVFEATMISIKGNQIICNFEAKVGGRLIASGTTGQKILLKEKLASLFSSFS